jgi:putative MFS transporter
MADVTEQAPRVAVTFSTERVTNAAFLVLVLAGLGWLFDAMVINMFALILPNFLATYHQTIAIGGVITSTFLVGYTIGSFLGGTLADHIGRKKTLGLSISSYSLGMGLSAFAPTIAIFGFFRFVTGIGGGMELPTSAVYVAETWPRTLRARALGFMHSFYGVGYIIAIGIAAAIVPLYGWRWAFLACVVPGILIFAFRLSLQESDRYRAVLEALRNATISRKKFTLAEVFQSKYAGEIVRHGMLWTSAAWGYWAFAVFVPYYLTKEMHYPQLRVYEFIAIFNIAGVFGSWGVGWLADRYGRRPFGMLCPLIAMGSVIMFSLAKAPEWILFWGSLELIGNSGSWVVAETFSAESFPTTVRGTAFSTTLTIGRIVSIFAPIVVGSLAAATSLAFAYRLSVAPWLLAVIAYAFSRETKGIELSDA